mgnify:CR=1 FL=1
MPPREGGATSCLQLRARSSAQEIEMRLAQDNRQEDERKAGKPVPPLFTKAEKIGVAIVVIVALVAIIAFASGKVSL